MNIKNNLLKQSHWEEYSEFCKNPVYRHINMKGIVLISINDRKITHENLDIEIENELGIIPKIAIFISRHTSKTGEPTLTVHPIGNYGEAKFGGKTKTIVKSSPKVMTELLRNLNKNAKEKKTYHKVCFEVTHHGPFLNIPSLFIEVGSTENEWKKQKPAKIVAQTILDLLENNFYEEDFSNDIPVLIGIGGGHYAPRFTDVAFEKNAAFGHMIPNYQIESGNLNDEIINKTIDATPNFTGIYLHKKSMKKSQVTNLKNWFNERDISVISSKELPNLIS